MNHLSAIDSSGSPQISSQGIRHGTLWRASLPVPLLPEPLSPVRAARDTPASEPGLPQLPRPGPAPSSVVVPLTGAARRLTFVPCAPHRSRTRAIRRRLASAPNLTYVTADLNMPEAAVRAQLDGLPFGNACFDVVICSQVLEHVEHDLESMAELHRVLARTGQALIMVPVNRKLEETYEDPSITDPEARKRAFDHPGHLRYYGADVTTRLEESGFEVEPVDYVDRLPPGEAERINAPPGELIYVCSR